MPLAQKSIASPFNARSTAEMVMGDINLSGKTVIVTGASTGLGAEAARVLAKAGAALVLPARSRAKAEKAAAAIKEETGNKNLEVADMDLADYASVRKFADDFLSYGRKLDLLINNAGIMATPLRRNAQGYESQFASNHLGHMLLTCSLAPALLKAGKARVVMLSSAAHRRAGVNFEDPNYLNRAYDEWEAYGQSKTGNALFALDLNRRLESKGVTAYSVHPGIITTELTRDLKKEVLESMRAASNAAPNANNSRKNIGEGAATTIWCAVSPLLEGSGGVYCENCDVAEIVDAGMSGVKPWAVDPDAAQRLWTLSEKLLNVRFAL